MTNLPAGVSTLTPQIVGAVDGTYFLADRKCGYCGSESEVEVYLTTDGITAWETWTCPREWVAEGVSCEYENHSEYDAEQLQDPDREIGPLE